MEEANLIRDELAKGIVAYCFRNTCFEDYHAGKDGCTITNDAVKQIMIEAVDRVALLLDEFYDKSTNKLDVASKLISINRVFCHSWDKPDPEKYREEFDSIRGEYNV